MQGAVSHQVWRYGAKSAHTSGHAAWQALTVDGIGQEHMLYGAVCDTQTSLPESGDECLVWCARLFEETDTLRTGKVAKRVGY